MARSDVTIAVARIPGCRIFGKAVYSRIIGSVRRNA